MSTVKSVLEYGSRLKVLKVLNSFIKVIIETRTWYMNNTGTGQIVVNNSFFENLCSQRHWGMLLSRVSYKKFQKRVLFFMESSRTKPILIENSENTLLETENLNFRLDFVTGLKRKQDDMEFILAKRFKRE